MSESGCDNFETEETAPNASRNIAVSKIRGSAAKECSVYSYEDA